MVLARIIVCFYWIDCLWFCSGRYLGFWVFVVITLCVCGLCWFNLVSVLCF